MIELSSGYPEFEMQGLRNTANSNITIQKDNEKAMQQSKTNITQHNITKRYSGLTII